MRRRRTRDGYLYPVDVPWGNMGTSLGGVCMAAIYAALPGGSGGDKGRARCFMQSQLAYITNHKCSSGDAASHKCRTRGAEGFSYIVGCAPLAWRWCPWCLSEACDTCGPHDADCVKMEPRWHLRCDPRH